MSINIGLVKLVRNSDFKEYRFFVPVCKSTKGKEFNCSVKLKDGCVGLFNFKFENPTERGNNYELMENVDLRTGGKADDYAWYFEKCGLFKFDFIEHKENALYIHLLIK